MHQARLNLCTGERAVEVRAGVLPGSGVSDWEEEEAELAPSSVVP